MKRSNSQRAFTVLELMIVVVILALLFALFLSAFQRAKRKDITICCNCNLKQVGLAFRVWSGDHGDIFPMRYYTNGDGTMRFADASNLFRYFQAMSNELNTPIILACPADKDRPPATNFASLSNSNISYFVGLDADETQPSMFLSGDRNIRNGSPMQNGLLTLTTNQHVSWTREMHRDYGNVGLADGSAEQLSSSRLQNAVAHTGTNVNRLLFPR